MLRCLIGSVLPFLLALAQVPRARAEEAQRHLGGGLAAGHVQLRDDLVLPTRTTGPAGGLALSYAQSSARGEHTGALLVGGGFLDNRFGQRTAYVRLGGGYEYARALVPTGIGIISLGGFLRGANTLQYHLDWDDAHLYWFTAYDLGPLGRLRRPAFGGTFTVQVAAALAAFVSRPPEHRTNKQDALKSVGFLLGRSHEGLALASLNDYLAAELRVSFTRPWGRSSRWLVSYGLDLRRYDRPRLVGLLAQSISLEVQRGF